MYIRIHKKNDTDLYGLCQMLKKNKISISGITENIFLSYIDGKLMDVSYLKEYLKSELSIEEQEKDVLTIIVNKERIDRFFESCDKGKRTAFAKAIIRATFGTSLLRFFTCSPVSDTITEETDTISDNDKTYSEKSQKTSTHNSTKGGIISVKEKIHNNKSEHNKKNNRKTAGVKPNVHNEFSEKEKINKGNNSHIKYNNATSRDTSVKESKKVTDAQLKKYTNPLIPEEEYFESEPKVDKISGFLASVANWES